VSLSIVGIATYLGKFPNNQFPGLAGAVLKVTDTSQDDNDFIFSMTLLGASIYILEGLPRALSAIIKLQKNIKTEYHQWVLFYFCSKKCAVFIMIIIN
jgi:hypothetical protein